MKQEIEKLMQENNAAALWISGAAQHNPSMVYLTGDAHLTSGDLFFQPGRTPCLLHGPMERDEAAKSGYQLINYASYPLQPYLEQAHGDRAEADALRYQMILKDVGLTSGKVLLYGEREFGPFFDLITRLKRLMPELDFQADINEAVLMEARATKSPEELEHIRQMGKTTVEVVAKTLEFLRSQQVSGDVLVQDDGSALTIGDVKRRINLWLAEEKAENPEDTIFAIGRDAGVPHSSGTPSDPIRLGETIVYDIFPCEAGGGYFYDFTRTWCLGYASDEIIQTYDQVKEVYDKMLASVKTFTDPGIYQDLTCDLFEEMGHDTIRKNPLVQQGYVHSLGHGVGLNVHEKPWFRRSNDPTNILRPGSVFTLEPGLYYPEKGFGIRLEDTFFMTEDLKVERFVDFPMELVIPMKGS